MKKIKPQNENGAVGMSRGPRPWKALEAVIPIAKTRGIIPMATGGTDL